MRFRIRWGRVVAAAFLSEAAVILVLLTITTVHSLLIAPGRTEAEYQEFAELAGYYAAPTAGGVATFLSALWAARKLKSDFIANGTLVGVLAVVLTFGFLFGANPEHRLMYMVSFALRIAGGYAGGLVARTIVVSGGQEVGQKPI